MTFHTSMWIKTAGSVCIGASLLFARVEVKTENPDLMLGISGQVWDESGQMVKCYVQSGGEVAHAWINRTFFDLTIDVIYSERLKMVFGIEGETWFNFAQRSASSQDAFWVHKENSTFIVKDANGTYSFGDVRSPYLSITAGLFSYKYNPQARNLGEYLFRSGTYPAFLINNFDLVYARLTGFKLSSDLFEGKLHQDLIYNIETEIPPFFDGTVSYLVDYNLIKMFDFGAGISFYHLVSVDDNETTPTTGARAINNQFINAPGDTGYYTVRGTKLMGRLCFDPKAVLNLMGIGSGFFGNEDLKLYGEALVLGLENYPANDSFDITGSRHLGYNTWGYDSLKKKIPVIFGFNVPTLKILDVLSTEFEWYGCPYPNSYANRLGAGIHQGYPVPDDNNKRPGIDYAKIDSWKWSVYAKKTFLNDRLGCVLQVARDHIRNTSLINEAYSYEEALSKPDQWYWMAKIVSKF
jgi:hypothetical protein